MHSYQPRVALKLNSIPLEGLTKRNVPAAPEIIPLKGTPPSCTPHIDTHGIAAHNVSSLSSQLPQADGQMGCLEGQGCLWLSWLSGNGRCPGVLVHSGQSPRGLLTPSLLVLWLQVDRRLEGWIWKLAEELKTQLPYTNVIIADWLSLAHAHYPIAVQNTRDIGQEIARFLEWLEVSRGRRSSQAGCSREPPSGGRHP